MLIAIRDLGIAEERKFTRLDERDIRSKVIGKVITDDAHWSDYFAADSSLVSWSLGRKSLGRWQIRNSELCITEEDGGSTCYQVWMAGEEISLRLEGVEPTFTGYLRKHEGQ